MVIESCILTQFSDGCRVNAALADTTEELRKIALGIFDTLDKVVIQHLKNHASKSTKLLLFIYSLTTMALEDPTKRGPLQPPPQPLPLSQPLPPSWPLFPPYCPARTDPVSSDSKSTTTMMTQPTPFWMP